MSRYITRVELHGASGADYELLHQFMARAKFQRTIIADNGVRFDLPTATYFSSGTLTCMDVRELAERAAGLTGRQAWVIVTEAQAICWRLAPTNPLLSRAA